MKLLLFDLGPDRDRFFWSTAGGADFVRFSAAPALLALLLGGFVCEDGVCLPFDSFGCLGNPTSGTTTSALVVFDAFDASSKPSVTFASPSAAMVL
jgi:hypothetical protein